MPPLREPETSPFAVSNIAEDLGDAKTGKNASRVAFIVSCLWGERDPVPASSASYFAAESVRRLVKQIRRYF